MRRQDGTIAFMRAHTGCTAGSPGDPLAYGVPTYMGPHLNPFVSGDESMSPCVDPTYENRLTELTTHILGDLGVANGTSMFMPMYTVDHSRADRYLYGYMRGCEFEPDPCPHGVTILEAGVLVRCVDLCTGGGNDGWGYLVPMTMEGAQLLANTTLWPTSGPVADVAEPVQGSYRISMGIVLGVLLMVVAAMWCW